MQRLSWTRCGRSAYWKDDSMRAKKRKPQKLGLALLVLLCVLMLLLLSWGGSSASPGKAPAEASPAPVSAEETPPLPTPAVQQDEPRFNVELPYDLEGGELRIISLFQTDALNPDCDNAEGSDLASVELVNLSDSYLEEARLTILLTDGTTLEFLVQDLPAGMTVWAFETGNQSISDDAKCEKVDCTAQFLDAQPLMSGISTEANDAYLTVTNQTGADIAVLTLRIHCLFENVYFGGKSVEYTINNLANGAAAEIYAAECYMGTAQAVAIR